MPKTPFNICFQFIYFFLFKWKNRVYLRKRSKEVPFCIQADGRANFFLSFMGRQPTHTVTQITIVAVTQSYNKTSYINNVDTTFELFSLIPFLLLLFIRVFNGWVIHTCSSKRSRARIQNGRNGGADKKHQPTCPKGFGH